MGDGWRWRDLGARPLWFPALALASGAACGFQTPGGNVLFPTLAVLLAGSALVLGRRAGAHLLVLGAFALAGAALARWERLPPLPPVLAEGGAYHLEAEVRSVSPGPEGASVELAVYRVAELPGLPLRFGARLWTRGPTPPWTSGQRLLVQATLKPLEGPLNWGEADTGEVWRRRGIAFGGTVDGASAVALTPPSPGQRWLSLARERLRERARSLAPSPDAAALYATLAAGLRVDLGAAWEQRFSESGLAHVLSVSGLHVAALALILLGALRVLLVTALGRWIADARRLAALLALPLVWGYVLFTGSQPAAVRSGLMASAAFLALALGRRVDSLNSLALAALVLVCCDPASIFDLSLQLSFGAVASLILLSPRLRQLLPWAAPSPGASGVAARLLRWREAGLQTFAASLAVTLGSAPLLATVFHRLSLVGLFSNIVCMPLCGALTGLSAGGAALLVLAPPLSAPCIWLGTRAAQALLWAVALFSRVPGAAIAAPAPGGWELAAFAVGLLALAFARGAWARFGLLAPAALVVALLRPLLPGSEVTVTFLSVGQGDSAIIEAGGQAVLVDGGGVPGGHDPGERVVVPYLRERGVRRLALAALSHPHPDHALGLITALSALPASRLWLPAGNSEGALTRALVAAAAGAQVEEVSLGREPLRLGPATLSVLGPPKDVVLLKGVNDRSLVLRLSHGDVSFLFPGDLEAAGEEQLHAGPTTVLKAPHHGSSTSSTPGLLDQVRPRFVVFCVGRRNRFHFPRPEVVERYRARGTACFRTDLNGAVRFHSDGRSVRVETFVKGGSGG